MCSRFVVAIVSIVAAFVAAGLNADVSAQSDISEYRKIIDDLLVLWNDKRQPYKRDDIFKRIVPSLEGRVKEPVGLYEDAEWLREGMTRLDKELPSQITPRLRIATEATARYTVMLERTRLPVYARRYTVSQAREDLPPKFYSFMAIAQRQAEAERSDQILFRHLRRALFFLETLTWPIC